MGGLAGEQVALKWAGYENRQHSSSVQMYNIFAHLSSCVLKAPPQRCSASLRCAEGQQQAQRAQTSSWCSIGV